MGYTTHSFAAHQTHPQGGFEHELSHQVGGEWDTFYEFNLGVWQRPEATRHPYQILNQSSRPSEGATADGKSPEPTHASLKSGAVKSANASSLTGLRSISEPGISSLSNPHPPPASVRKRPSATSSVIFPFVVCSKETVEKSERTSAATGPVRASSGDPKMSSAEDLSDEVAGAVHCGDIPPDLLPTILERVSRKGKGGRQPAADPRTLPGVDPKRAKRIIANRESAARSKLKQKVLMETLKTRQDVLVTQRMTAQEELELLRRMCRDLQSKNAQLEARIKILESSRAHHASQFHMDVDHEDQAGASGSGLAPAPGHNPALSFDDQTLAGISTLASMAAARERHPPPAQVPPRHSPHLWTPSLQGSGEPQGGASRDAILEVLQAQHLQAQQQQQQQEQKVQMQPKPGSRQAPVSRPQPQLLQLPKVQSPFFGSLPFGSPDPTGGPPPFSSAWPAFSPAPPTSSALASILKPVPVHPSSGHTPTTGAMDIKTTQKGGSSGQGWVAGAALISPSLITPALAPQQPKRDRDS